MPLTGFEDERAARVWRDPEFHAYRSRRGRFAWVLSALTVLVYFGFIALVAFAPGTLGQEIGWGSVSLGIALGVVVILAACLVTWVYVLRANTAFDRAVAEIRERSR